MALAECFEDLRAWQAARALTLEIYTLARREQFRRDLGLSDQIRRASVSTMNDIAEGFDDASRIAFVRFLRYASRSASEVQSCLHVALDQHDISREQFDRSYANAASVRKLCTALIRSLRPARDRRVSEPTAPPYGRPGLASARLSDTTSPVTAHRSPVTPC